MVLLNCFASFDRTPSTIAIDSFPTARRNPLRANRFEPTNRLFSRTDSLLERYPASKSRGSIFVSHALNRALGTVMLVVPHFEADFTLPTLFFTSFANFTTMVLAERNSCSTLAVYSTSEFRLWDA